MLRGSFVMAFLIGVRIAFGSSSAQSATKLLIKFIPPDFPTQVALGPHWTVYLDGIIDDDAAERFAEEIAKNGVNQGDVFLNSPGGNLLAGMKLGRLIRKHGLITHIAKETIGTQRGATGECLSACVFAFVGGYYRFQTRDSMIGVHRFSRLSPSTADLDLAQMVSGTITAYLSEMGVDIALFELMSRVGKDEIYLLPPTEAKRLRVVNNGILPAEWTIEAIDGTKSFDGTLYLRGVQETLVGTGKAIFLCAKGKVFFEPMYEAGKNAKLIADSAIRHSIRFDNQFIPLDTPVQPLTVSNGYVGAVFSLKSEHLARIGNAQSIGYAAYGLNPDLFWGFTVEATGAEERIRGFLKSCRPGKD